MCIFDQDDLNPASFTRKLKEWAWTIGQKDLLTENAHAFVAYQLQITDLARAFERR